MIITNNIVEEQYKEWESDNVQSVIDFMRTLNRFDAARFAVYISQLMDKEEIERFALVLSAT